MKTRRYKLERLAMDATVRTIGMPDVRNPRYPHDRGYRSTGDSGRPHAPGPAPSTAWVPPLY